MRTSALNGAVLCPSPPVPLGLKVCRRPPCSLGFPPTPLSTWVPVHSLTPPASHVLDLLSSMVLPLHGITSNSKPYYDQQAWHHLPLAPCCLQPLLRVASSLSDVLSTLGQALLLLSCTHLVKTTQIVPNFPPSAAQSSVRKAISHDATSRCKFSMANAEWPPRRVPCTSVSPRDAFLLSPKTYYPHPPYSQLMTLLPIYQEKQKLS